jgi:hypothetical protein
MSGQPHFLASGVEKVQTLSAGSAGATATQYQVDADFNTIKTFVMSDA